MQVIEPAPNCNFESDNDFEIPALDLEYQGTVVDLPCYAWRSAHSRQQKKGATIHFYTNDRHFRALSLEPAKLLQTPAVTVVEPNFSLDETTPMAIGLERIFQKRWMARFWQLHGRYIFIDLHVPAKYRKANLIGVPAGWKAYATRGGPVDILAEEMELAKEHAQSEQIHFAVMGCNIPKVQDWCRKNRAVYIPNFRGRESESD